MSTMRSARYKDRQTKRVVKEMQIEHMEICSLSSIKDEMEKIFFILQILQYRSKTESWINTNLLGEISIKKDFRILPYVSTFNSNICL